VGEKVGGLFTNSGTAVKVQRGYVDGTEFRELLSGNCFFFFFSEDVFVISVQLLDRKPEWQ
jgi:hypothetical protein